MKRIFLSFILCILSCILSGCGLVVGTVVDTTLGAVAYPFQEYVFLGAYKYDHAWKTPYIPRDYERDPKEILVGFAVAEGGSRSTDFMACVADELSQVPVEPGSSRTYLDELDYISGVSGGSLASAYLCMNLYDKNGKPNEHFLSESKKAMSTNFQIQAFLQYTVGFSCLVDFLPYYDCGDVMGRIWDQEFFAGSTLEDLYEAEMRGAPTLIINGTEVNTGTKFVFSNLSYDHCNRSEYFETLRESSFINYSATKKYKPFQTNDFHNIQSDIRPYRLSKAVVASASVPNLLGLVTLKDRALKDGERLIHIVDGGVYDNDGIERLVQIFTQYPDKHPGKRAKIVGNPWFGLLQGNDLQNRQLYHCGLFRATFGNYLASC